MFFVETNGYPVRVWALMAEREFPLAVGDQAVIVGKFNAEKYMIDASYRTNGLVMKPR